MKPMMTEEPMGIDSIIQRVDSYAKNPKLVTPETLMELKAELEDLKPVLDGEEPEEPEEMENQKEGGLSIIIGKMKGAKE